MIRGDVELYYERQGTKDYGKEYEIAIITLIAIRLSLDPKIKNFKISTNNKEWGDFDDAVFEIFYNDGTEIIIAIQLKHTEKNMTEGNVTNSRGDYSLDKYYKSYKEIRKSNNSDLLNKIYFVLYTHGGYSKTIEDLQWHKLHLKKKNCNKIEWLTSRENCSFQFEFDNDEKSKKCQFLSQLFIFTNQNDYHQTKRDIFKTIKDQFQINNDIFEFFFPFMDRWRKGHLGCFYKLTRNEFVTEICELLLVPYMVPPSFEQIRMNHIELWNKAIRNVDVTFVDSIETIPKIWYVISQNSLLKENWIRDNWSVPVISVKNIDSLPERFLLNKSKDYKISLKDLYLVFWKSGLEPLFLKIDRTISIINVLNYCKTTTPHKYFIINSFETNFENFSKFRNLNDLTEDITSSSNGIFGEILALSVTIQDRFEITFREMYDLDENFFQNFATDTFLEFMENPKVGIIESSLPPVYIKRKISEFHINFNAIKYIRDEIVFILCNLNHFNIIKEHFPSRVVEFLEPESNQIIPGKNIFLSDSTTDMQLIRLFLDKTQQKYHIFLMIEKYSNIYTLKWLESTGSIGFIKEFLSEEGSVVDENDLFKYISNPINVISASPGMGKTSLINKMCRMNSDFWIIKIELIEHTKYFDQEKCLESLNYFCEQNQEESKLEKLCFESFAKGQKVIILIDGFDEISPKYTKTVLAIIHYFKSKNFIQWIMTRPSTKDILEKEFNVLSRSICPFNEKDRNNFIRKFTKTFSKNAIGLIYSSLKTIDTYSLLTTIPLQMSMICETVINNSSETPLDILELYEQFINIKFDVFAKKYLQQQCNPVCYEDLKEQLRELQITHHQLCSLITLFGRENTAIFVRKQQKSLTKFLERIHTGKEKNGIIMGVSDDNIPIFIHQTYAEYFAATWFAENWEDRKVKKLLGRIFSHKKYWMVRLFFDKILIKSLHILQAVIDQNSEKIKNCSSEDLKCQDPAGRNALHLACSWSPLNGTECLEILLKKGIDPQNGRDQLFNLTPIDYADRTNNVVVIDKILQHKNLNLAKLQIFSNIDESLMLNCIKEECITLFTKLSEYLNSSESWTVTPKYDNLIFYAVETDNVEIVKILLNIKKFKKHIRDTNTHGNAALQLAIMLNRDLIVKKLMDFGNEDEDFNLSPYEVAMEEATGDVKKLLNDIN